MYFEDEFLKSLPDDSDYAIIEIAKKFDQLKVIHNLETDEGYPIIQEVRVLFEVYSQKRLKIRHPLPNLRGPRRGNIENMSLFIKKLVDDSKKNIQKQAENKKLKHYKNVFEIAFGDVFHFEFTEGDLERIQQLINELRDLISKTKELKQKHKQRLLIKLEKLQTEFHKKMPTLDRALGAIIETGVALGQFGEDIEPLTDRIKELAGIILSAQKRAYELPSSLPFKLFGQPEDDKSKDKKS